MPGGSLGLGRGNPGWVPSFGANGLRATMIKNLKGMVNVSSIILERDWFLKKASNRWSKIVVHCGTFIEMRLGRASNTKLSAS